MRKPEQLADLKARRAKRDQITPLLKQLDEVKAAINRAQFYGFVSKDLRLEADAAFRDIDQKLREERRNLMAGTTTTEGK